MARTARKQAHLDALGVSLPAPSTQGYATEESESPKPTTLPLWTPASFLGDLTQLPAVGQQGVLRAIDTEPGVKERSFDEVAQNHGVWESLNMEDGSQTGDETADTLFNLNKAVGRAGVTFLGELATDPLVLADSVMRGAKAGIDAGRKLWPEFVAGAREAFTPVERAAVAGHPGLTLPIPETNETAMFVKRKPPAEPLPPPVGVEGKTITELAHEDGFPGVHSVEDFREIADEKGWSPSEAEWWLNDRGFIDTVQVDDDLRATGGRPTKKGQKFRERIPTPKKGKARTADGTLSSVKPEKTFKVFRGESGTGEPNDFGALGKGEYWSGRRHVAEVYAGPSGTVREGEISLANPLEGTYDQLNSLQQRLFGRTVTGFDEGLSSEFDAWLRAQGYDGVVAYDPEISISIPEEVVKLAPKK